MTEDKALLKGLRAGSREALRLVYEKYKDDLLTVAVSLLADIGAAEDCLQDVFVSFAETAGGVRIRRNLKGYLLSCVANRARDHLRKKERRPHCRWEDLDYVSVENSSAKEAVGREEGAKLFEVMAKLPLEQRQVITLHLQGEMKFREIASVLGESVNTVQSRYRYGIEKLRDLVKRDYENEIRR